MAPAHDSVDLAEGRALLARLPPLFLTAIETAQLGPRDGGGVFCAVELPELGTKKMVGSTARDAIREALFEIAEALARITIREQSIGRSYEGKICSYAAVETNEESSLDSGRFKSKGRQLTIGISIPSELKNSLTEIAEHEKLTFSHVARQLAEFGFENFDERSFYESPNKLISQFSSENKNWGVLGTEQVMLRLDPSLAIRIRASAKANNRSASEFGVLMISNGLFIKNEISEVERQISKYKGAATRRLALDVGLGAHAALLSGILVGSTQAPRKIINKLSDLFSVSEYALREYLKISCQRRIVPSFKSENGKPEVYGGAKSWREMVASLKLPAEQAEELLKLDE
ncbi:MAG: hypothetical protein ACOY3X_04865 [Pseudomonadota bacterium]